MRKGREDSGLVKRGLKGHLTAVCNDLVGSRCRENRAIVFSEGYSGRTKSKGHKLEHRYSDLM